MLLHDVINLKMMTLSEFKQYFEGFILSPGHTSFIIVRSCNFGNTFFHKGSPNVNSRVGNRQTIKFAISLIMVRMSSFSNT